MPKELYEEALADVRRVKQVAEENAKRELEAIVTPRIRELIEAELLKEDFEDEEDDVSVDTEPGAQEAPGEEVLTDAAPMAVSPEDTSAAITPPDAEGKVTLDLDALGASAGAPITAPMTDVQPEDDVEYGMDAQSVDSLAPVVGATAPGNDVGMSVASMGESIQRLKTSQGEESDRNSHITQMISRVENMYEYVQAKVKDSDKKAEYETQLESMYRDLNKLQEQAMSKKGTKQTVNESDLTLKLTNVPLTDEADLEEVGVELVTGEEEEGEPGADRGGEEGAEGGEEGGDLDLGDLGLGGEEEEEEEPPMEGKKLSDDTIVEIDERMLQREISRMKKLREAAPAEVSGGKGAGMPANILDDFGDGEVEGEPFLDLDVTTEADEPGEKDEVDEADMDELQNRRKGEERGAEAADGHSTMGEAKKAKREKMLKEMRARRAARLAEQKKTQGSQNGDNDADAEKLRAQLAEVNLINAKLLYTNKLLQLETISTRQKAQVIERLDEAKTLREAKLVYEGLVKILTGNKVNEGKERGKVLGSSSRVTAPGASSLNEGFETNRWQELAGITSKKR